jgi:hypothetical protein
LNVLKGSASAEIAYDEPNRPTSIWSSSLQDELGYIVKGFREAKFTDAEISGVLKQQYDMLDKLKVPYTKLIGW